MKPRGVLVLVSSRASGGAWASPVAQSPVRGSNESAALLTDLSVGASEDASGGSGCPAMKTAAEGYFVDAGVMAARRTGGWCTSGNGTAAAAGSGAGKFSWQRRVIQLRRRASGKVPQLTPGRTVNSLAHALHLSWSCCFASGDASVAAASYISSRASCTARLRTTFSYCAGYKRQDKGSVCGGVGRGASLERVNLKRFNVGFE